MSGFACLVSGFACWAKSSAIAFLLVVVALTNGTSRGSDYSASGEARAGNCERRGRALICYGPNATFGRLGSVSDARNVSSITLRGQLLRTLGQAQLKRFPYLINLSIDDAELETIENHAFDYNPFLEHIVIRSKRMTKASWRWFQRKNSPSSNLTVDLRDADLECRCENLWIEKYKDLGNRDVVDSARGISRKKPILQHLGLPAQLLFSPCRRIDSVGPEWYLDCPTVSMKLTPPFNVSEAQNGTEKFELTASKHNLDGRVQLAFSTLDPNLHRTEYQSHVTVQRRPGKSGTVVADLFANTYFPPDGIPEVWVVARMDPPDNLTFPPPPAIDMSVIVHQQKPHIEIKEEPANKDLVEYRFEISSYPPFDRLELPKIVFQKQLPTPLFTTDSFICAFDIHEFSSLTNSSLSVRACNEIGCSERMRLVPNYPSLSDVERSFLRSTKVGQTYDLYYRELWLYITLATFVVATVSLALGTVLRNVRQSRHGERLPLRSSFSAAVTTRSTGAGTTGHCGVVALEDNPSYTRLPPSIKQIPGADIEILDQVGEGAFGIVYEAAWYPEASKAGTRVAAKGLKPEAGRKEKIEFEREAIIMQKLSHENIIHLFGVVVVPELLLIFEFMDQGDLKTYLVCRGPNRKFVEADPVYVNMLSVKELIDISWQLSNALTFLAQHHFVHRDVAARNCLVAEPLRVKLGDFGLSRDVYVAQYYKLSRDALLPVRWLAPESVKFGRFTVESDVWSFGILMWEIFSYGELPWSEMDSSSVIKSVKSGEKLPPPQHCPYEVYELMLSCWRVEPAHRAKMLELKQQLSALKKKYS